MKKWLVLAFMGLLTLTLTGCPKPPNVCEDDGDCGDEDDSGRFCVNGQCQECTEDQHCRGQAFLDPAQAKFQVCRSYRCTRVECVENADCLRKRGKGFACMDDQCQPWCDTDEDCPVPQNQQCKSNQCVPRCECSTDADCAQGYECQDGCHCTRQAGITGPCANMSPVYFDFDEYAIRGDQRPVLDQVSDCMKGVRANQSFTLEGHADERGTSEYNYALGERRANSARKYLVSKGIDSTRMSTVSYGEDRPADPGHGEDAWARNRRVVFTPR